MSLFGQPPQNNQQSTAGSLFGGAGQNTTGNAFGQSTGQATSGFGTTSAFGGGAGASTGGGLFGNNNNQTAGTTGTSTFGNTTTANTTAPSLFGNTNTSNTATSSLFGNNAAQNTTNAPTATGGSLFGGNTQNQGNTTGTSSLFGGLNQNNNAAQPATGGSSLFGSSLAQPQAPANNAASLFGGNRASLFGQPAQPAQSSNFGAGATSLNQPQSNQLSGGLQSSLYQPQNVPIGNSGHTITQSQLQRLQMSGISTIPNEKSIADQIQTLYRKWNPNPENNVPSQTILRTYFYNAVEKAYAPFVYPSPTEDPTAWEEALSRKPSIPRLDNQEPNLTYVPSQCVGFYELSLRLEKQAQTVQSMRARLHEMNNSLSAIMAAHEQRLVVKIAAAKRTHAVLAQRCLRLAGKVQILRNRGYALDGGEEELRRVLLKLEGEVMDPGVAGREDEIWARLVALRERTRWLEEEGGRVAAQVLASGQGGEESGGKAASVPEGVLVKTRKILRDYGEQLGHLQKELVEVQGEYAGWQEARK